MVKLSQYKGLSKTKKFGEKVYELAAEGYSTKAIAQKHADGLKAGNCLVRVIEHSVSGKTRYAVYAHEK